MERLLRQNLVLIRLEPKRSGSFGNNFNSKMKTASLLAILLVSAGFSLCAQPAKISVDAARPSHAIPMTLWGIFFEDINLSADGGIYPELVRNRSFEDADTPEFWELTNSPGGRAEMSISTADVHAQPPPLNPFNRKSLRVKADGGFALKNEGYWGMNIVEGNSYTLKFAARVADGFNSPITTMLIDSDHKEIASGQITGFNGKWTYFTLKLAAKRSDPKAQLVLLSENAKG